MLSASTFLRNASQLVPKYTNYPTIMETIHQERLRCDYQPTPDEDSVEGPIPGFCFKDMLGEMAWFWDHCLSNLGVALWTILHYASIAAVPHSTFPASHVLIAGGYPKIELVESTCRWSSSLPSFSRVWSNPKPCWLPSGNQARFALPTFLDDFPRRDFQPTLFDYQRIDPEFCPSLFIFPFENPSKTPIFFSFYR